MINMDLKRRLEKGMLNKTIILIMRMMMLIRLIYLRCSLVILLVMLIIKEPDKLEGRDNNNFIEKMKRKIEELHQDIIGMP